MTSDHGLTIYALDGANPLAFLAAIGLLSIGDRVVGPGAWRLSWTRSVVSTPVLHGPVDVAEIVDAVLRDRDRWIGAAALEWNGADDVKFSPNECSGYLIACAGADDGGRSVALATALVAEGGVDRSGTTKPSDLHFTAGQQKLLAMMRRVRDGLVAEHCTNAILGDWRYDSTLPSLKWDVTDDRVYALSASDPAGDKKLTNPGAEWLAINGLVAFPVFASSRRRTTTTACEGAWKSGGSMRWPLWAEAASAGGAASLVAHSHETRASSLAGWGVFRLLRSSIRRSDQGGYGSFSPPTVVWEVGS